MAGGKKFSILVVDDERSFARYAARLLRAMTLSLTHPLMVAEPSSGRDLMIETVHNRFGEEIMAWVVRRSGSELTAEELTTETLRGSG